MYDGLWAVGENMSVNSRIKDSGLFSIDLFFQVCEKHNEMYLCKLQTYTLEIKKKAQSMLTQSRSAGCMAQTHEMALGKFTDTTFNCIKTQITS